MPCDPLLLRVPEVARLLGLHRGTVYDLMNRGELESVKIGSARRVPRQAVDAYVERIRQENAP